MSLLKQSAYSSIIYPNRGSTFWNSELRGRVLTEDLRDSLSFSLLCQQDRGWNQVPEHLLIKTETHAGGFKAVLSLSQSPLRFHFSSPSPLLPFVPAWRTGSHLVSLRSGEKKPLATSAGITLPFTVSVAVFLTHTDTNMLLTMKILYVFPHLYTEKRQCSAARTCSP